MNEATTRAMKRHGELPLLTLTVYKGKEFAAHEKFAQRLGVDVYFARPYHTWERGTWENTNGLVRPYLPKGMDLRGATTAELKRIEKRLNGRPRKRLRYRTPEEVLRPRGVAIQIRIRV